MVKNKNVMKVNVEKSEFTSSKIVNITDMKGNVLVKLHVFIDGDVFVNKARNVWISEKFAKKMIVEEANETVEYDYLRVELNNNSLFEGVEE
jgi:hypothetical protein